MLKPVGRKSASLRRCTYLLLAVLALPTVGQAGSTSHVSEFQTVRDDVTAFRQDKKRRQYRHHYLKLIKRLVAVADATPDGKKADDARYVAAQLWEELSQVSGMKDDVRAAIDAYLAVASQHESSNLADDALYAAALLRLERVQDAAGAREALEQLLAMRGKRDFKPRARALLAQVRGDGEIPGEDAGPTASREVESPPADTPSKVEQILARLEDTGNPAPMSERAIRQVEVLPEAPPPGTLPRRVTSVAHRTEGLDSVVALQVSGAVGVRRGEIPATRSSARRLFFDLTPAKLGEQRIDPIVVGDGTVRRVRAGQYDNQVVRLVVELEGEDEPSLHIQRDPFELRLITPLSKPAQDHGMPAKRSAAQIAKATPSDAPAASSSGQPSASKDAPNAAEVKERLGTSGAPGGVSISQQFGLKVRRIVLDAGHGGHDTGAVGPTGVREKDVTLAIARRVRARLQKKLPDVEVVMTRDEDAFIELTERTRIANDQGADLFISIHANANPSRKVHGVETYYLNITHDRYSIRLAARENAAHGDDASISDLQYILADLAMKSNVDDSIRLGRQVQSSVVGRLRQGYSRIQDLGLKHALFAVLIGAKMPAILVETSFVSNRVEEKRLKSEEYQDALAEGIVQGVRKFLEERQAFLMMP